jgi:hypothetical protein
VKRFIARASWTVFALASSCSDPSSHPYIAEKYEPARDCLDHSTAIDVVNGPSPGASCAAVCLFGSAVLLGLDGGADGGGEAYVSTMCPPYPPLFDTGGTNPVCTPALAALTRSDVCLDDGGSTNPLIDAGVDSGVDAGVDAGAD